MKKWIKIYYKKYWKKSIMKKTFYENKINVIKYLTFVVEKMMYKILDKKPQYWKKKVNLK